MAFAFDQHEPVPNAVRRLVAEQLDRAVGELAGAGDEAAREEAAREKAVHEARKALKRCRSVVRLAAPGLGKRVARAENAAYRDAGRALSAARDADVLLRTWDSVVGDGVDGVTPGTVEAGRAVLEARRDKVAAGGSGDVGAVVDALREARRRTAEWPELDDSWAALAPGLRSVYERGRAAMSAAVGRNGDGIGDGNGDGDGDGDGNGGGGGVDDEAWHEWRKRVKDTWYHVTLLVPAWPPVLGAEEDELHHLSELLGDDHDLAVLGEAVRSRGEPWSQEERTALLAAVEGRRLALQGRAADLGRRAYAAAPKAFAARLGACWDAWRAEGVTAAEVPATPPT